MNPPKKEKPEKMPKPELAEQVRSHIGEETLAKLAKQPLALTGGGIEDLLQRACKRAARHPNPLDAAVRFLRVFCGSSGDVPKPKTQS
jgi:hypothetical protein